MCGLAGFIDFSRSSNEEILGKMTRSIAHRGPDDEGGEMRHFGDATVGLGFRRLSVIDLSPLGHQPMINDINGDILVFNGEVYNYAEIRKELESLGHAFKSHSDTEVVLKSFQAWGSACVHKFIGMFAIVIYNPSANKVHIFRDRAGVKPLYYYWDGTLFLFASELKAFHQHPGFKKKIDFDSLRLYFHHGYIPAPYSIFKNTQKLSPGSHLEFNLRSRKIELKSYWNILDAFNKPKLKISYEEATDELEKLLISSFNYRMIADVPVGVFLSGGYDSSGVTALIQKNQTQKLKTFTIGFENELFNESHFAKGVSNYLGTDHHEYLCSEKEATEIIQDLPDVYDEPLADGGAIPNILVCKLASKHVKVVLSADGGDEVFAGYSKYFEARKQIDRFIGLPDIVKRGGAKSIEFINRFRTKSLHHVDRLSRIQSYLQARDGAMMLNALNQTFTEAEISSFLKIKTKHLYSKFMNGHLLNKNNEEIDRVIAIDYQTYLVDDILAKVDRATSFLSLEGREPLLDHRIAEFAATLPADYKMRNGVGKSILRNVVHRHIPKELVDRPKQGFGLPISTWGLKELKPLFDEAFDAAFLRRQKIFSVKKVRGLYEYYMAGNEHCFDRIYEIFVFQMWYKRWME
ncbi:MAG: asparagine synthase (glutamine-hydrolyzing) [Bacteroidetes bacterium]|nr:asparagine synthase (glutamine-hydrolyzing) [Bacteroidota bacterium]